MELTANVSEGRVVGVAHQSAALDGVRVERGGLISEEERQIRDRERGHMGEIEREIELEIERQVQLDQIRSELKGKGDGTARMSGQWM